MQKSYQLFAKEVESINFNYLKQTLKKLDNKFIPQQMVYQPNLQSQTINNLYKKVPYINNQKLPYQNRVNLYLKILSYLRSFVLNQNKQIKTFIQFLQSDKVELSDDKINNLLNKIDNLRVYNHQYQLLFYIICDGTKNKVRNYLKLRQEITSKCSYNKLRNNPVAIHNQNKYFQKDNPQIGHITINYEYWAYLASILNLQLNQQIFFWISNGGKQINSVNFIILVLWAVQQSKKNKSI